MYSGKSNTFVRQKPSQMNAAVTQEVLVIPAPSLEGIYLLCSWCLICIISWSSIFQTVKKQTRQGTWKDRILWNSLERQTPRCQMLLLLFPAETDYHSTHPNCLFHLEDLYVNISLVTTCSPEGVQHRKDEQLSMERDICWIRPWQHSVLALRPQEILLSWILLATSRQMVKSISKMTNSRAGKPQKPCNL